MNVRKQIKTLNRTEDATQLRQLVERLQRVCPRYKDMRDFFHKFDPTIDESRFEELMQIADNAP